VSQDDEILRRRNIINKDLSYLLTSTFVLLERSRLQTKTIMRFLLCIHSSPAAATTVPQPSMRRVVFVAVLLLQIAGNHVATSYSLHNHHHGRTSGSDGGGGDVVEVGGISTSSSTISTSTRRGWFKESASAATSSSLAFLLLGGGTAGTTMSSFPIPANAATTSSYTKYDDPVHGFSIDVPANWAQSTQTLADRRYIQMWTDPDDVNTLLFIAYTPVRDDFTSLSSFGSVEQVAEQTILPKGKIAGFDVESKMLATASKNQAYYFDYVQEVPNVQPQTHVRAIFALAQGATGGAGAVLVTVTGQAPEARYGTVKSIFDHAVDSYGKSTGTGTS